MHVGMLVYRWEDNIKMEFKEWREGEDHVYSVVGFCKDRTELLCCMEDEQFLE
jgi:hypothetical protein